jgi:hypothetical protein
MLPIVIMYLMVFVITSGICGMVLLADGGLVILDEESKRVLSRAVLLSPVWPLALIVLIICGIKPLWKMSGWGK